MVIVILDPEAFFLNTQDGPGWHSTFRCYCSTCVTRIDLDAALANPRFTLLAPTRVDGFLVGAKKWSTFPVRDLSPYSQRRESELWNVVCLDQHVQMSLKEDFFRYFDKRRLVLAPDRTTNSSFISGLVVHFHGESCGQMLSSRIIRLTTIQDLKASENRSLHQR